MGTRDLLKKLKAYHIYCDKNYSSDIREGKKESLVLFTQWLEKVWLPADDIKRKHITEGLKKKRQTK